MRHNVPLVKRGPSTHLENNLLTDVPQWSTVFPKMSNELLTAEIKTRVQPTVKRAFEQLAEERHLDTADIVREALREFLSRQSSQPKSEGVAA